MKYLRKCIDKIVVTTALVLIMSHNSNQLMAQVTIESNNPTGGAYLGWDGAQDLDFKTNDILRLQLMETQTSTINGFAGIAQGGFLGLSDELNFFNPGGTGPYSMLHIGLTPLPPKSGTTPL